MPIGIYVIDAFKGPRHAKARAIWDRFAAAHTGQVVVRFIPSVGTHAESLANMWAEARKTEQSRVVLTEMDFLPYHQLASHWPQTFHILMPVEAAEYCTRDPVSLALEEHRLPAGWFIRIARRLLNDENSLDFCPGGPFNDPANMLGESLANAGQGIRLLPQRDCRPLHWGTRTKGSGEHLFFSRHWNGDGSERPGGLPVSDILVGVDKALDGWHF